MNRRGSLRRGCSLLLALALCLSLLPLSAMAAEECRYGQEGCVCTEAECLAECQVCHPAEEETAGIAGEACQHEAGENPVAETAATCAEEGRRVYTCALCGEEVTETIPAAGHTPVTDEAVAATETETGLTEGAHCAVCGAVLTAQEIVPVLEKREDPEAAALQAFYDAVDALEALNGQEDPDPDAVLAAQEKVTGLYKGLTQVQKDNLNPIYTEMVRGLETPVTMEEPALPEGAITAGTCEELVAAVSADTTPDGTTIYITSDITMTKCARFYNKSLIIDGQGHTLTRGDDFAALSDDARSWYNPAMIEVQTTSGPAALTLKNITLDDAGKHEGTVFAQAISGENKKNNLVYVQDAIVATNATYPATITLGEGTTLCNFGGESAVRVTSEATVIMESGSKIEDTIEGLTRVKGEKGSDGPAGAIWIQGSKLVMEQGAEITKVDGRAVYIDGGSAMINGTISNITANANMWQGQSGAAIHVRNKGYAVLGETGVIDTVTGNGGSYTGAVMTNGSRVSQEVLSQWLEDDANEVPWDFEAKPGSIIRNVSGFPTMYSNWGTELLNGTITGCSHDFVIGGFAQKTVIGKDGVIESCTSKGGAANATVYTSNASKIYLKGKVRNNTASHAVYIINQSGGGASLDMYDGALISGTSGEGVYINASECALYMHGGTITGNGSYGVQIREKGNRSATMIMDGGEITNNKSYGVYYNGISGSGNVQGYIDLNGGKISGNGSDYSPYQVYISGAYARDDKVRAHIASGVVQAGGGKQATVYTSFGTLTLNAGYDEIDLGNAKSAASGKITELVNAYQKGEDAEYSPYVTAGSALWFKPTKDTLHFVASRSSSINPSNYLKLGYIQLKADGTPVDGADLTVLDMENTDPVDITLDRLKVGQPYAMMWVVPNESATGSLKLTGDSTVSEILGQTDPYQATYTFNYKLNGLNSSISAGDTFMVTIMLDKNVELAEENPVTFSSRYFEADGEQWYHYNEAENTLTASFKAKGTKWYTFSDATITVNTTFAANLFDSNVTQLVANAATNGRLATTEKPIDLKTNVPTITKLVPLGYVAVVFETGDGGSAVETKVIKTGSIVTRPDVDPTRFGYAFNGWTLDGETYDFTLPVTEDITLVAQWTPIPMSTVTFDANGGVLSGASTVRVPTGSPVSQPTSPTRGGYTFTGWTLNGSAYSFTAPVNADITLVAQWSYNGGGGGGGTGGGGGGGGRGTTTIIDQPVPLAGDLQLNREDHFAYIKGYEDGTVRPNNPLTRAQVATIYYRLLTDTSREIYFQETNDFTDVPADFWACKAISTLSNAGIINGFEDGTFRPNAYITRAQFIAMTSRFETVVPGLENVFTDVPEAHWARDEIAYAAYQGWLSDRGTFRPQENITRVETMEIINNVLERHVDQEGLIEGYTTFTDVPVTDPRYYTVAEATNTHDYTRRTEGQLMENWSALREDPVWDE